MSAAARGLGPPLRALALALVARAALAQGNPLGPEFRVNTYTTGEQRGASVAADAAGGFVVVWTSQTQDGSSDGVFGQRYDGSGFPLGPEFQVNSFTTSSQYGASVAAGSSGEFVVVWDDALQDGSGYGVFGQRYASSGAPLGAEFRVNTVTTGSQYRPSVAAGSSGNFAVVWQVNQPGDVDVSGQRYSSAGAPLGPEFRVNTYTTGSQYRPSVAADAVGNLVVVWTSYPQDGSFGGIFGQRFASSGAPLGPEFRVNTSTQGHQAGPDVAAGASGSFVVVWASNAQGGVFGQRYDGSGAPAGAEFRVNTTAGLVSNASVASDPDGNFAVVWRSGPDGSGYGIFGQRYTGSGIPLGPEFRVNTFTTANQENPDVVADASGGFVVVWQGDAQDGSGTGVFGQRYAEIVPLELLRFEVE